MYAEGASDSYVYCAFRLIAKTGLTQAEDGYFEIYNANDLKEFADLVNNTACTNAIGGQPEKNLNLRLMNDIDMTSINDTYIPIGSAINGKFGSIILGAATLTVMVTGFITLIILPKTAAM